MDNKQTKLADDIRSAINRVSRENVSGTPDFILAEYLMACLSAFENASNRQREWGGVFIRPASGGDIPKEGE